MNLESLVEIKLKDPESFLLIKETLTRIGVSSKKDKTLFQSCHILHKQGKYYLMHFKELFLMDGKTADITSDDFGRRNMIAKLLEDWGLLDIVSKENAKEPKAPMNVIKIIPHSEKNDWKLVAKYTVGRK